MWLVADLQSLFEELIKHSPESWRPFLERLPRLLLEHLNVLLPIVLALAALVVRQLRRRSPAAGRLEHLREMIGGELSEAALWPQRVLSGNYRGLPFRLYFESAGPGAGAKLRLVLELAGEFTGTLRVERRRAQLRLLSGLGLLKTLPVEDPELAGQVVATSSTPEWANAVLRSGIALSGIHHLIERYDLQIAPQAITAERRYEGAADLLEENVLPYFEHLLTVHRAAARIAP